MDLSGSINVRYEGGVYGIAMTGRENPHWFYQGPILLQMFLACYAAIVQAGR